jgi:UDPglucose 6-dehydrogenase
MKICVIGAGYVGLVTAACFAEMGHAVHCVDKNPDTVDALNKGRVPFHEPGLNELVENNHRAGRLHFVGTLAAAAGMDVCFVAVNTPSREDGSANLDYVLAAARDIGLAVETDCVVVDKSTVPVGTADQVRQIIQGELGKRNSGARVEVVSNPEFLKEGSAVNDFMRPDRVIVGSDSARATEVLRSLYGPFTRNHERLVVMGVRDAEMTKYAANAMLATRISFMNEIAGICERLGVDVENVRRGIGSDSRIGYSFIYPGSGYGGSCFPKDIKALMHMAQGGGVTPHVLRAVEARNEAQKRSLFEKLSKRFGAAVKEKTIGIWGLAFKPGTDDVREAPALVLINQLIETGATVKAYDPVAMENAKRALPKSVAGSGKLQFVQAQYEAVSGADALALVTEWKPFRNPDFALMKRTMRSPIIFDGRNQYDPKLAQEAGFEYFGIGR